MIRLLVREVLVVVAMALAVSLVAFTAFDVTGHHDWYGTLEPGRRAGLSDDAALGRDLPLVFSVHVQDARTRTLRDLADLSNPALRIGARAHLLHRGTAALPTALAQLRSLPLVAQEEALSVLAEMSAAITGGERPPTERAAALDYWERFYALRGLDFRPAFVRRLVQRLTEHDSRNAVEQLSRLGTFALPELFDVLDAPLDGDAPRRLIDVVATVTGRSLRIAPGATVDEMRSTVEAWRAWWFSERLEYEHLGDIWRAFAHVTETRYGRWLTRLVTARLGRSRVTGNPILAELRARTPRSVFVGGLGGLFGVAFVVAFGGGAALRRRPLGVKLLDLAGALIPGLIAFVVGFVALNQILVAPAPVAPQLRAVLEHPVPLVLAVAALAPLAVLWLRRSGARKVLDVVRVEAEAWARRARRPRVAEILRHGLRVGLASLLAPVSLAALPLVLMTLAVEPALRVRGMGSLTDKAVLAGDAPWLLVALLSIVPLWLFRRWADRTLAWALAPDRERMRRAAKPAPPPSGEAAIDTPTTRPA